MATILITPSLRAAYGFARPETVSAPSQSVSRHKQPRAVTERAIVDALYRAGRPLSRLEIAQALAMRKTPWLVSIVEDLTRAGALTRSHITLPHGVICYLYTPTEG